jgi:predicted anti-sigma-YlaC factor YlaD
MTCAFVRELAPEFALGVLSGAERAETVAHLHDCASCRQAVSELSAAVDVMMQLAPEADPPVGFEAALDARIRGARRRAIRRWTMGIAAVAAVVAVVAVTTVRLVQGVDDRNPVAVAASSEVRSAPMIGGGGSHVGQAFVYRGNPSWISVTVGYTLPTGDYQVQLRRTDGHVEQLGTMHVIRGKGSWGGAFHRSPDSIEAVQMRSSSGPIVCRALLTSS